MEEHGLFFLEVLTILLWLAGPAFAITAVLEGVVLRRRGRSWPVVLVVVVGTLLSALPLTGLLWGLLPHALLPRDPLSSSQPAVPPVVFLPAILACAACGSGATLLGMRFSHGKEESSLHATAV